jgi:CheY-like chemotaxis protein
MPVNWLIAEDEADIRNLVGIMCQVWGHTPLSFETGQKVWDWLDDVEAGKIPSLPEFALMDIRMPGRRGNEIAGRMREIDRLKHIPIVLMTAFVLSEDEIDRLRQDFGVDHVINKPLPDFDRLGVILHDIIKRKAEANKAAPAVAKAAPPAAAPASAPVAPAPAPTPAPAQPVQPSGAVQPAQPAQPSEAAPVVPAPVAQPTPTPTPTLTSEPTKQHPIQPDVKKPETPQ